MHLGGLLSTQEARVALGYRLVRLTYASFVLSNLPLASITPWLHTARLPFLKCSKLTQRECVFGHDNLAWAQL